MYNESTAQYLVTECYTQYHMKVLLNSFELNGHTVGFHPQTLKLEPSGTV